MQKIIILSIILSSFNVSASNDREQIKQAVTCFSNWDQKGGTAEQASKCMHPKFQMQSIS